MSLWLVGTSLVFALQVVGFFHSNKYFIML